MSQVELRSLTKHYGRQPALDNVEVSIRDGEFFVIFGRPGAGKSTTLKVIAGIEDPTDGQVVFGDQPMNGIPPQRRNVAMAFESYALYPHISVAANLEFPLKAPGRSIGIDERQRRISEVAELLEITPLLNRRPSQLSGGQRQRVSLGRALVRSGTGVSVTLLDEPIAHLDARLRHWLRGELRHYQQKADTTTVYASPDYVEAFAVADRLMVLIDGRVRQVGTPLEIQTHPADTDVAGMIGDPKMNLLGLDSSGELARQARQHGAHPAAATVGIWPTDAKLDRTQGGIPGTVYVVEPLGEDAIVRVDVPGGRMQIKTSSSQTYRPGEPINVHPAWERAHYFGGDGARIGGGAL
ncbi:MAG: ABC transporter ATP-binding protein [Chloroflexi bacterium]|nr:ABC transporter ATP-binding protein [Chloroflexota bacterium]